MNLNQRIKVSIAHCRREAKRPANQVRRRSMAPISAWLNLFADELQKLLTPTMKMQKPVGFARWKVGQRVEHKLFGFGIIKANNDNAMCVSFDSHGEKEFLAAFLSALNIWRISKRGKKLR